MTEKSSPPPPFPSPELRKLVHALTEAMDEAGYRAWVCVERPQHEDYAYREPYVTGAMPAKNMGEVEDEGRIMEQVFMKAVAVNENPPMMRLRDFDPEVDDFNLYEGPHEWLPPTPELERREQEMMDGFPSSTIREHFRRLWRALVAADTPCYVGLDMQGSRFYFSHRVLPTGFELLRVAFHRHAQNVN